MLQDLPECLVIIIIIIIGVFTQAAELVLGCSPRQHVHNSPEQDVKLFTWPHGIVDALESKKNVSTDNADASSAVVNARGGDC